jgi:hypothetical protein
VLTHGCSMELPGWSSQGCVPVCLSLISYRRSSRVNTLLFRFGFRWRHLTCVVLAAGLLSMLPQKAWACDPNCDVVVAVLVGVPTAALTTLIAPLVGRALDTREHPPYWTAVGVTAAASGGGVLLAASRADVLGHERDVYRMVAVPAVMGVVATVLVYRYWPRREDGSTGMKGPRQSATIVATPVEGGGTIGVHLRF